jgi:restriction system protein
MPVPTYENFIEPTLRFLFQHKEGAHASEVHDAVAGVLGLSDADRTEVLPSGEQAVYKNRAGWAHDRLKRAGLSSSPRRGYWQLTEAGVDFTNAHPQPLTLEQVDRLALSNRRVRLRPQPSSSVATAQPAITREVVADAKASPDDRLEEALEELRDTVVEELLEVIGRSSPTFFEQLVLDLLHAMGYGTSRSDLLRVGGAGDAGIDGVISLDRLGLEKVYVQAKRWQSSVGRPEVQAFYGALAGQRANKGVFITTSTFTEQALQFAKWVERIVLVDGERLASLMIEHAVGVSHRVVKVPKLDSDYFEG